MILFGQYSLVAYLVQIAVLQMIVKVAGIKPKSVSAFFGDFVYRRLTFLFIIIIHALRQRSRLIDSLYKAVFA